MTKAEIEATLKLKDEMSGKLAGASRALDETGKSAGGLGKGLELLSVAGKAASIGIAAATAAATAAVAITSKATQAALAYADQLDNQAKATQASVEALQVFNEAAKRAGQSPEAITTAIQRMQRAIGDGTKETTEAINKLGLSVSQLRSLRPEEQFRLIMERLGGVENAADKTAIAMELLGRSGANLLALSGDALPELEERMRALGLVVDQEVIASVDRLGDDLDLLSRAASQTWVQFGAGIASSDGLRAGVNLLTDAIGKVNAILADNQDTIAAWVDKGILFAVDAIEKLGVAYIKFAGIALKVQATIEAAKTSPLAALLKGENPFGDALSNQFAVIDLSVSTLTRKWARGFEDVRNRVVETAAELGGGSTGGGAGGRTGGVVGNMERATEHLKTFNKMLADSKRDMAETAQRAAILAAALEDIAPGPMLSGADILRTAAPGVGDLMGISGADILKTAAQGVGDIEFATKKAEEAQLRYNSALQQAANLATFIPGKIGQIVGQTMGAVSALSNLSSLGGGSIFGGLKSAFSAGTGGKGGIMGFLGGVGGVVGAIGPLIGPAIAGFKALFGKIFKGPDLVRDAARDMGATITKEMAEQIRRSGKPLQLAVADIFRAGGFASADKFAEEIGDIFSGLQRGEFSKPEAIKALEQAVPLLIQNMKELGPEGEAQIQRIIGAARSMGIEFEGLSELIQGTFAPDTVEAIAEKFGITNDQVRELAEQLGVNVQTELERMAAALGLNVEQFEALGAAVSQKLGIPIEDVDDLLASMGVSAEDLAKALGVELPEGAGDLGANMEEASLQVSSGADHAFRLANELERAAKAAGGIRIPTLPGGDIPGFQHGGFIPATPGGRLIRVAEGGEGEFVTPQSRMGMSVSFGNIVINGASGDPKRMAKEFADEVATMVRRRTTILHSAILDVAQGKA